MAELGIIAVHIATIFIDQDFCEIEICEHYICIHFSVTAHSGGLLTILLRKEFFLLFQ